MAKKLIQIASILLFLGGFCAAAVPVDLNDFKDTTWTVYGTTKASASKAGSFSTAGLAYVTFNSDGSLQIKDEDDFIMSGNYYSDAKGKLVINVSETDVQKFFDDYVQEAIDDSGLSSYIDSLSIVVTSTKTTTKVGYTSDRVSLATTLSAKARLTAVITDDVGTKEFHANIAFTTKLSGDRPVSGSAGWASQWIVNSKVSLSTKKVKVSKPLPLEVTIADINSSGLGVNEFTVVDINAVALLSSNVQGEFIRMGNKMILGSSDNSVIEDLIVKLINENPNVNMVTLQDYYPLMTATVKDGKSISVSMTCDFWVDIYFNIDPIAYDVKGTLKLTGKGVPAK
jgi:hypothetical protein